MGLSVEDPYLQGLLSGDFSEMDPEELERREKELREARAMADKNDASLTRNVKAGVKQGGLSITSALSTGRGLERENTPISFGERRAIERQEIVDSIQQGSDVLQPHGGSGPGEVDLFLHDIGSSLGWVWREMFSSDKAKAESFYQTPEERTEASQADYDRSKADFDRVQEISQAANIADLMSDDNPTLGKALRGSAQSLLQMGIAMPTGALGIIGGFTAMATNDALHDARDSGIPEDEQVPYAIKAGAIEGIVTSLFHGMGRFFGNGVGGLESMKLAKGFAKEGLAAGMKQAGVRTISELTEENIIGLGQALNSVMADVDPEALSKDRVIELLRDTTLTTLITQGAAESGFSTARQLSKFEGAKVPTRKEMADLLGVKPKDLPDNLKSRKGRKQAVVDAILVEESEIPDIIGSTPASMTGPIGQSMQSVEIKPEESTDESIEAINKQLGELGEFAMGQKNRKLGKAINALNKADSDPVKMGVAIHKLRARLEGADPSVAESMGKEIDSIEQSLKNQGYEVINPIGQKDDEGADMKKTTIPDFDRSDGDDVITKVTSPQIMKDGKLIQAAEVEVSVGMRPLSESELAEKSKKDDANAKKEADLLAKLKQETTDEDQAQEAQEVDDETTVVEDDKTVQPELDEATKTVVEEIYQGETTPTPAVQARMSNAALDWEGGERPDNSKPNQVIPAVPTENVHSAPDLLQYKAENLEADGSTGSLKHVTELSQLNLGSLGVPKAWYNKAEDKIYIVDGHNRLAKAKELGLKHIPLQFIEADNFAEARSQGALLNMMEGNGTAIDAAKYLRDSGNDLQFLKDKGVKIKQSVAGDGLALSKLHDSLFADVIDGTLPKDNAVALAKKVKDKDRQFQIMEEVKAFEESKGEKISPTTMALWAGRKGDGDTTTIVTEDLFAENFERKETVSIEGEKMELQGYIIGQIQDDRKAFSGVVKGKEALEQAGNVLKTESNKQALTDSQQALKTFKEWMNFSGPLATLIKDAAIKIKKGDPNVGKIKKELYEQVKAILPTVAKGGTRAVSETTESLGDVEASTKPKQVEEQGGLFAETGQADIFDTPAEPVRKPFKKPEPVKSTPTKKPERTFENFLAIKEWNRNNPDKKPIETVPRPLKKKPATPKPPIDKDLPPVDNRKELVEGDIVDGRKVVNTDNIPGAQFQDDKFNGVVGIKEVHMSEVQFIGDDFSDSPTSSIKEERDEIASSNEITPSVVNVDSEGGLHLVEANGVEGLFWLGAKSFPAKIYYDKRDRGEEIVDKPKKKTPAKKKVKTKKTLKKVKTPTMQEQFSEALKEPATAKDPNGDTLSEITIDGEKDFWRSESAEEFVTWGELKHEEQREHIRTMYHDEIDATANIRPKAKKKALKKGTKNTDLSKNEFDANKELKEAVSHVAQWRSTLSEWKANLEIHKNNEDATEITEAERLVEHAEGMIKAHTERVSKAKKAVAEAKKNADKESDHATIHKVGDKAVIRELNAELVEITTDEGAQTELWKGALGAGMIRVVDTESKSVLNGGTLYRDFTGAEKVFREVEGLNESATPAIKEAEQSTKTPAKKKAKAKKTLKKAFLHPAAKPKNITKARQAVAMAKEIAKAKKALLDRIGPATKKEHDESKDRVIEAENNLQDLLDVRDADKARKEAEKSKVKRKALKKKEGERGSLSFKSTEKPARKKDNFKFLEPDSEGAYQDKQVQERDSIATKVKSGLTHVWHSMTRAHVNIPNNEFNASAGRIFRTISDQGKNAIQEAEERVLLITDSLKDPADFNIFNRQVFLANLHESMRNGEPPRHRFTLESAKVELDRLAEVLEEEPQIQEALDTREKINAEFLAELQKHGIIPEGVDRKHYFRQIVQHDVKVKENLHNGIHLKKISAAQPRVRGDEDLGPEFDYVTAYLESELSWMIQAGLAKNIKVEIWDNLERIYAKKPMKQFKKEAKAFNQGKPESEHTTWQKVAVQHGFKLVQPKIGSAMYRASSLSDQILADLEQFMTKSNVFEISKDDLKDVLVLGSKFREIALPAHIADQLEVIDKKLPDARTAKAVKSTQKAIKAWLISNPNAFIGYWLRNLSGDIDPVIAANPRILRKVKQAFVELMNEHSGNTIRSENLRIAHKMGVIDSGMVAKELPKVRKLKQFKHLFEQKGMDAFTDAINLPGKYFNTVRDLNEMRENTLRYATMLSYMEDLGSNINKINYGATKPEVIDGIIRDMGTGHAAAKLANDLIGDYGNTAVFSQWMRDYVYPFYSFQAINMRRAPRMVMNILTDPSRSAKGRTVGATVYATALSARMMAVYAMFNLWNYLMFPDEEEKLAGFEKNSPHLILGMQDDRGKFRILRNVGTMGDVLETYGVNSMLSNFPELMNGQMSFADFMKDAAKAPINKLVGGVTPLAKIPLEAGTGLSFFPDFFNPRQIEPVEHLFSAVRAGDLFNEVKGKVLEDGSRSRGTFLSKDWWDRRLGVSDTKRNTVSASYGFRNLFLKSKDKVVPSGFPKSKWENLKRSVQNDDFEAFKESRQFLEKKHDIGYAEFTDFLRRLSPMEGMNKELRAEFETEFLTHGQLKVYEAAKVVTHDWQIKGYEMWRKSVEEQGPEALTEFEAFQRKKIDSVVKPLHLKRPPSIRKDDVAEWERDQQKAMQNLIVMGVTRDDIVTAMRREGRSPEYRSLVISRYKKQLAKTEVDSDE